MRMISAENYVVVRTPLLPIQSVAQVRDWSAGNIKIKLGELFASGNMQEAIYLASPELYQEWERWQGGAEFSKKDELKLQVALVRYLDRMSSRSTPYGMFAGCQVLQVGARTDVYLKSTGNHLKRTRLDMNYVGELVKAIVDDPIIREQLKYFPNTSLYRSADRWRYATYSIQNKIRNYHLTAVQSSSYLDAILNFVEHGAMLKDIRQCVFDIVEDISKSEVDDFISELIGSQVLLSELEPSITGPEFFQVLIGKLAGLKGGERLCHTLKTVEKLLESPSILHFREINKLVRGLLPGTESKDLLQTDLYLATDGHNINKNVLDEITASLQELLLTSPIVSNPDLEAFCTAFSTRYEEREVSLAEALDAEAGVGYGAYIAGNADHTPLVDDLVVPAKTGSRPTLNDEWMKFQVQLYMEATRDNAAEVCISRNDITRFKQIEPENIPSSIYAIGKLLGQSASSIDNGHFKFDLSACGGPSTANLLGRFCHGLPVLETFVKDSLEREATAYDGCILAEVVHLPESRTGNILARPNLRTYEIVYLANSQAPQPHQIKLDDLLVKVVKGKVWLRSKSTGKYIIPRMSTAHNFQHGLPVYKFLCDLQYQGLPRGYSWQWQLPFDVNYFPRVSYGKLILSKRTWIIKKSEFEGIKKNDTAAIIEKIQELAKQFGWPSKIVIAEGDNELLVDLESEFSLHVLAKQVMKYDVTKLQEFLQVEDQCWVEGEAGTFCNELIIPMHNPLFKAPAPPGIQDVPVIKRTFWPGSEWLYLKIYAGSRGLEDLLKEAVWPLVQELKREHVMEKWFYIRYNDPGHHLRLRFYHPSDKQFGQRIVEKFYNLLNREDFKGLYHKLQLDTYERELERYGDATMEMSEDIFEADSDCALGLISLLNEEEGERYRWLLTIRGIDMLLEDFGFTLTLKQSFMDRLREAFFQEFGASKELAIQLNDKYRKEKLEVQGILDPGKDNDNGIEAAISILKERSGKVRQAFSSQTLALDEKMNLASSYIHMFVNRMLLSNQRKHELILYHFLAKYYASKLAIQKKQEKLSLAGG